MNFDAALTHVYLFAFAGVLLVLGVGPWAFVPLGLGFVLNLAQVILK